MKKRLQETSWKKSQYEHPHRAWVCGLSDAGLPCSHGPDSKGRCPLIGQCTPAKQGDEYVCCRPEELGGSCTNQSFADPVCQQNIARCNPNRSWMHFRKRIVVCTIALALGFSLLIYGKSSPTPVMSPGLLSFAHGDLNSKCADCHTAADGGLIDWASSSLNWETAMSDSQKCLACHEEIGETPFNPHGMTLARLQKITQLSLQTTGQDMVDRSANDLSLTCSRCHHEHQGQGFDITKMADSQCQLCHQKQFQSFSHGHPEFVSFPYESRSKIYFDHARHYGQYFEESEFRRLMPDGVVPKSCSTCHQQDATGRFMQTAKYETMCANCHDGEILDLQYPGVPFFALPSFSPKELPDDSKIKSWPNTESFSTFEQMPPFMAHILEQDEGFQTAKTKLGENHFSKLQIESKDANVKVVENYLDSIRSLIEKIALNGDAALETGSEELVISKLTPTIVEPFRRMNREWFNGSIIVDSQKHGVVRPMGGGWEISTEDLSLRYRPVGHSDPTLKRLLNETVNYGLGESKNENLKALFDMLAQPTASGTSFTKGPIASGRCLTCHSVEQQSDGRFEIQWEVYKPKTQKINLTKFSHKPHLKMGQEDQCVACHKFEVESDSKPLVFQPQYFRRSATDEFWKRNTDSNSGLSSGFLEIPKNSCAECHTKRLAGESCLKCHDYHLLKSHK